MTDDLGQPVQLRFGVTGFLPPQTVEWDRDLSAHIECRDIIESARDVLPRMRAAGAQLVIALAHSGIGPLTPPARGWSMPPPRWPRWRVSMS